MSERSNPALVRELVRFQRRLRMIACVRYVSMAMPVATVVIGVAVIVVHPAPREALMWLADAAALAVFGAVAVAVIATPSLPTTARVLDGRFRLEDRVLTALELAGQTDPVSQLVVTDARTRLAAHVTRELSFESPPRFHRLSAAVAGVSLLLAIALTRPATAPRAGLGEARGQSASSASGGDVPKGAREAQAAGRSPADATAGPSEGAEPTRDSPGQQADASHRPNVAAAAPLGGNRQPGEAAAAEGDPSGRSGPAGSPAGRGDSAVSQTGVGEGAGARGGAGNGARAGVGRQEGSRGAGPGGASAAGAGADAETGAGGIKGSPLAASAGTIAPQNVAASASYAARYSASRTRAESAIAQERVPARLRAYVRDYFLAIRPGGQP